MRVIKSEISDFVILDKYSFYRASTLNLDRSLLLKLLSSFNEQHILHLFLSQICMTSILNLNTCFLKYYTHPKSIQLQVKHVLSND